MDGERGQGAEPRTCPFPAQVLRGEMRRAGLRALASGNLSSLDQASGLPCLARCVAHRQPGRRRTRQACKAPPSALHHSSGAETSAFRLVYQCPHIIPEMGWSICFPSFWLVFSTQGESVRLSGRPCSERGLETDLLRTAAGPPRHCSLGLIRALPQKPACILLAVTWMKDEG